MLRGETEAAVNVLEFYWEGLSGASLAKIVKDRESRTGLWGLPRWLLPMQ